MPYPYTKIEINKTIFNQNITTIADIAVPKKLALVVKGNGYGHGIEQIAMIAQQHPKIDMLCTAGLAEACYLRSIGVTKPILVMSYLDAPLIQAVELNITCSIHSFAEAQQLQTVAQQLGMAIMIHVKLDTGMGRRGILYHNALQEIVKIAKLPNIIIEGIFTHLSHTADPCSIHTRQQLNRFDAVLETLDQNRIHIPITHAISSSGLHLKTQRNYSLLRAGGLCYGLIKSYEHYHAIQKKHSHCLVRPIIQWKSYISSITVVPAHWPIGYNGTYITHKPTTIATVPIGYSDGYPRQLSNKGTVLVSMHNRLIAAPIIGIISMNMLTINVDHIPNITPHQPVFLLGSQEPITPHRCASQAGLITNQLMTSINVQIKRTIID